MKIYSIIVTVLLIIAGILAFVFYSQMNVTKVQLATTKGELQQSKTDLNNVRQLVLAKLGEAKSSTSLLNDSLAAFLVAGNLKITSINETSAQMITDNIGQVSNAEEQNVLAQSWSDFLSTKKISDYLAFSRFLIQDIQNNLESIR